MSPTTMPSGWAERSNCMMRSRGSVPIAASISTYRTICSGSDFFGIALSFIFLFLKKYRKIVKLPGARYGWPKNIFHRRICADGNPINGDDVDFKEGYWRPRRSEE